MTVKRLGEKRCWIGEGPVWNAKQQRLYFVNPGDKEICHIGIDGNDLICVPMKARVSSLAFDWDDRLIVAMPDGVYRVDESGELGELYDRSRYEILYANDGKVGPDGCFYIGTQSEKRLGISERVNGRLYRISPDGEVRVLLDGLLLSNGMDWSVDGRRFYHTDSDTNRIREYRFDRATGDIAYTGREVELLGVDGFSIDAADTLWAACWGQGHIARIDTRTMEVVGYVETPFRIPTSCCFGGEDLRELLITSAYYDDPTDSTNGWLYQVSTPTAGKTSYIFGEK